MCNQWYKDSFFFNSTLKRWPMQTCWTAYGLIFYILTTVYSAYGLIFYILTIVEKVLLNQWKKMSHMGQCKHTDRNRLWIPANKGEFPSASAAHNKGLISVLKGTFEQISIHIADVTWVLLLLPSATVSGDSIKLSRWDHLIYLHPGCNNEIGTQSFKLHLFIRWGDLIHHLTYIHNLQYYI